jgi:sugar phosphate isomerase/epimerase
VSAAGADPVYWIDRLAGRLDILHLKDMVLCHCNGSLVPNVTEVGYGNMHWEPIMAAAERAGVKHYVVEQDFNFTNTPFESLRLSAAYLKKYWK